MHEVPGAKADLISQATDPEDILVAVIRDVLERLASAIEESQAFETLKEARRHLALGLNALETLERLPSHQQDYAACRGVLVQIAVTSLKAVCNLYPLGSSKDSTQEPMTT